MSYFEDMREEALSNEKQNEGFVWTIDLNGPATVSALGLAKCTYNLHLSCSHVGQTMFGAYRGEMALDFDGDITGAKFLLALAGIRTKEDLKGNFKNDNLIFRLNPYDEKDMKDFIDSFDRTDLNKENNRPESKDELTQATYDAVSSGVNALLGLMGKTVSRDDSTDKGKTPVGLWYDWDFHMTEGDMGTFIKLNGGNPWYSVNGKAETDSKADNLNANLSVNAILSPKFSERYHELVQSPFPHTIVAYPDGTIKFTLYNSNGGPVTVNWVGKISCIPVSDTLVL